ncbi:MAG: motility protein A, partial [Spirochaetales bacterium]|nr:motility protein A [Spirochaetales bacterium]
MDISTIIGLVLAFGLIILSMALGGSGLGIYVDLNSFLMVIGGSFAAMMISNPLARVLGLSKILNHVFKIPNYELEKTISTLVNFSERARREGLLALEDDIEDVGDEFLKNGIQMVVDGTDPEIIKAILYSDLEQLESRHSIGIKFFS